jgi:hypothetical protein
MPVATAPATAAVAVRLPSKAIATLAALLVLTVPGAAIGATRAQPGQPLYGAKLGIERARLAMAAAPERNVAAHVGFAEQRLDELAVMSQPDTDAQLVDRVSENLHNHTVAATGRLDDVEGTSDRSELRQRIGDVVVGQVDVLDDLLALSCDGGVQDTCTALGVTHQESLALRDSTPSVTVAVETPVQGGAMTSEESAGVNPDTADSEEPAAQTSEPSSAASGSDATAGSEQPGATADPTATPPDTRSPPPAAGGAGPAASETASPPPKGSSRTPAPSPDTTPPASGEPTPNAQSTTP